VKFQMNLRKRQKVGGMASVSISNWWSWNDVGGLLFDNNNK
jgi:hypothetical protein